MCIVNNAGYNYFLHASIVLCNSCYGLYVYRGIFTVGVVLIRGSSFKLKNALNDYSKVYAKKNSVIARCVTGLGPRGNSNSELGGFYFNGSKIPIKGSCDNPQDIIISKPGPRNAGVLTMLRCGEFSPSAEGVYECIMMNSSMMNESIRFGVYFSGRSELFDIRVHPITETFLFLYTAAPVIDFNSSSSSNITVPVGVSLTLFCTSQGSPPDTFTWRKDNDTTVLNSTNITALDHSGTSALFRADYSIDSVTTRDSGIYTCTVTNPIGTDSTTITVVVISKLLTVCHYMLL